MNFRCCISFLYIFCFVGNVIAQERDSLIQHSYQALKAQYKSLEYTNPKSAKVYAEALLAKAKKEGNALEEHSAFLLKASSENYFGNMQVSMQYIDSCISYAKAQNKSSLYISALSQKGRAYFSYGKYTEATENYLKFDSIAKATKNTRYQIYANQGISSVKRITGDHKGAVALLLKNKEIIAPIIEEKNYQTLYLNTLIGLCSAYTYFDVDAAAAYLPELKKISIETKDTDALSYYFSLKGIVDYTRKEYDDALAALQQADSLATLLGTKRNLYDVYRFRGKSYYEKEMFSEAIISFEAIKVLQKEIEFDDLEYREVLSLLANSYEQIDSTKKALENYRLAYSFTYTDTIKETIRNTILKKYDNKAIEDKISILQLKTNKKTKQTRSLLIIAIGLFLALVLLFLIYKKRERLNKQKFNQLLEKLSSTQTSTEILPTSNKFQISDEKITKILEGLKKFEKSNAFLKPNTSLVTVSKKLNTNTTYLSQIVNEQKGVTFKSYITELRINYALHKLKSDTVLRSYSIKAIAKELGFKSEGAFSRAFKKQTGIYPSFFIKNLTAIL